MTRPYRTRGTGTITKLGYKQIGIDKKLRLEHNLIVENILGRALKSEEEVHHVNGVGTDNRHENLVVCPDKIYHMLLHKRQRALEACGNPDWRKCSYCTLYDDIKNMHVAPDKNKPEGAMYHKQCKADYDKKRNASK